MYMDVIKEGTRYHSHVEEDDDSYEPTDQMKGDLENKVKPNHEKAQVIMICRVSLRYNIIIK